MKGQGRPWLPLAPSPPNYYSTQLKRNWCSENRRSFGPNTWVLYSSSYPPRDTAFHNSYIQNKFNCSISDPKH